MRLPFRILFVSAVLTATISAQAATLTVTKTADTNDGVCDTDCSLREAVASAADGDAITFGQVFLTPQTIRLAFDQDILIAKDLTITGPGADRLIIDGGGSTRLFSIDNATVTISGMMLTGGNGLGSLGPGGGGGAIFAVDSNVVLDALYITRNSSRGGRGGAVMLYGGDYKILNSTLYRNLAMECGGIYIHGTLLIANSTISTNRSGWWGGGLCNQGALTIRNSTITKNLAPIASGVINFDNCTIDVGSSIIAANDGQEISNAGVVTSSGYNLIGDSPGDSGVTDLPVAYHPSDILDMPPWLSNLWYYGGPIPVHVLGRWSPAVDKGKAFGSAADQRGMPRTYNDPWAADSATGDGTDIGAVEQLVSDNAVAVAGRVTTSDGRPIRYAVIVVESATLHRPVRALSNQFGWYKVVTLTAGETYKLTVSANRHGFEQNSRTVTTYSNLSGVDFVASP